MPSDEDLLTAAQKGNAVLIDNDAERERLDTIKEQCLDWWRSPSGKECIRNAKTTKERFEMEIKDEM